MRFATAALAAAALCLPAAAVAAPPDLDVADLAAGETELEVNGWAARGGDWTVRPELEIALGDRLALELQADIARAGSGRARWTDVSAQLMAGLSRDGSVGVAAEAGVDPGGGEAGAEVFVFAARAAGAWRLEGDLGVAREGGETALAYAWRAERTLGGAWTLGAEGGGEAPLPRGADEHVAGPTMSVRPGRGPVAIRAGWFFGLGGARDLGRLGLEVEF